jgi:hypothetical protein
MSPPKGAKKESVPKMVNCRSRVMSRFMDGYRKRGWKPLNRQGPAPDWPMSALPERKPSPIPLCAPQGEGRPSPRSGFLLVCEISEERFDDGVIIFVGEDSNVIRMEFEKVKPVMNRFVAQGLGEGNSIKVREWIGSSFEIAQLNQGVFVLLAEFLALLFGGSFLPQVSKRLHRKKLNETLGFRVSGP